MKGFSRQGIVIGLVCAAAGAAALIAVLTNDPRADQGSGLSDEFTYDLEAQRAVDPASILYAEGPAIETGFSVVAGLAVAPDGRIFVAGDKAVRSFDAAGKRVAEFSLPAEPACIAADAGGAVYVGFTAAVEAYDAAGTRAARWDIPGSKPFVTSVAVAGGHVYVGDAGGRVVLVFDTTGKPLGRIGERDEGRNIPGIVIYQKHLDAAMGPDGLLRVANPGRHRVEAYTPAGDLEFSWGAAGSSVEKFCGCCNPTHIAILPGGGFATSEKGLPRLKTYDAKGAFEGVVAPPDAFGESDGACDLAADAGGRVLALDPKARTVRTFARVKEPK